MFKAKCKKCGKEINRGFDFCPFCGNRTRTEREEDFGFLGKDDSIDFSGLGINMPLGGIFNNLMKELDKQFKEFDKTTIEENKNIRRGNGLSISISTEPGKPPQIKVNNLSQEKKQQEHQLIEENIPKKIIEISKREANRMAKLPRKEAETKVRRMSNRIIYEISLPGVKKIDNIFINKLENSIEIKAFSKDKVYFKLIPVNLPILSHKLKEEKLFLELSEK
jgi:hypothetical protein